MRSADMMCYIAELTLVLTTITLIQTRCEAISTNERPRRYRMTASDCEVYQSFLETEFYCEKKLRINMPYWFRFDRPFLEFFCHSDDLASSVPNITFTYAYIHKYVIPIFYNCPIIKPIFQKFWPVLELAPRLDQLDIFSYGFNSRVLQFQKEELVDFQIRKISIHSQPVMKLPDTLFPSSLEDLLITSTNLTTIPDTIFTNVFLLHTLKLERNEINHIPKLLFRNLTELEVLSLAGNQLVDLDEDIFCGLKSLQEVDLSRNKFQYLPKKVFSILFNLFDVNLAGNRFISLSDFFVSINNDVELLVHSWNETCTNNDSVYHSYSPLVYLDISNNVYLNSSSIMNERRFARFPQLINLGMRNCSIQNIPDDFLNDSIELESLDLSNNMIQVLPESFLSESPKVVELDLSHNKLITIPLKLFRHKSHNILKFNNNLLYEIHEETFQNLTELNLLDLSHNNLTVLPVDIFTGAYNLSKLYLSHNKFTNISNGFLDLNKLEDLDLSYNQIKLLGHETFKETQNLLRLSLSNNGLENLSNALLYLGDLQVINLSHNELGYLHTDTFKGTYNIRNVYLNHNRLTNISDVLMPLGKVELMDLSYNELSSVKCAFINNSNLLELDLSHNRISIIDKYSCLDGLGSLKSLSLANNEISYVESHAFAPVAGLISLDLANNSIDTFNNIRYDFDSSDIVYDLTGSSQLSFLQYLDLTNNSLTEIPKYFKEDLTNLRYLGLNNNKIFEITSYDLQYSSYNLTVDVQRNLVENINLKFSQLYSGHLNSNSSINVNLNYNPLLCNCDVFHFMKLQDEDVYMYNDDRNIAEVTADKLSCSKPKVLQSENVESIQDWTPKALLLLGMCLF